ncbi:MAG: hypothetical protein ACYDAM_10950 [Leptospirales bacterium]
MKTRDLVLGKIKKNPVDSYKDEPTKPTEPSFEGFDGSLSHESGEKKENDTTEPNPVSTLKTEPLAESFLSEMNEAPTFLELLRVTDRIDPSRFTQDEFDELWAAYCRNRDRWPDEAFPATGWGTLNEADEPAPPGTPESGQRSQESRHPEQITPSYGWTGQEVVIHDPSTCQNQICVYRRSETSHTISTVKDSLTVPDSQDPEALAERIALKFEEVTPAILGKPVIVDRGHVLACENDLPHVKVYAWALLHLNTGEFRPLDISKAVKDCRLTTQEVREAIARLVTEKDLIVERSRKGDLFRLNIQYGGTI